MKSILLLCGLLMSAAAFGQEGSEACAEAKTRYFGQQKLLGQANARLAFPGDETIDVTYYKLNLSLTYTPKFLVGEVTINFKSKTNGLTKCWFDLNTVLKTDSVKVAGKKVAFTHTDSKLNVTLGQTLNANQAASVVVYYRGTPPTGGFGSFEFGTINQNKSNAIWSLSEPFGSGDWFPSKDNPADKADSTDIWITAPSYFTSVSNGLLEKVTTNTDGTKTYRWKSRYPIAPYLISIACSNYVQYDNYFKYSAKDSMVVNHFIQPDNLTAANKANLDLTPTMLKLFTEKYGPYPFLKEKYAHAQFGWSGGMEHQTASSMVSFAPSLIAHELAHQWFGDKVTCQNWENIWLNEGFATFSEALWAEFQTGTTGYNTAINTYSTRAKAATSSIFVRNATDVNSIFNSNRTYSKGCMVIHMLRGILGDAVFYKSLQAYMSSKHAYGNATTEDFQAIVEATSGQKFDYFFKQWIYGESFPTYRVSWSAGATTGSKSQILLNIAQKQQTTEPSFFTMPLQIGIKTSVVDTTITVLNNQLSQDFTLTVRGTPQSLTLDPNNWVLKTVEATSSITSIEPLSEPLVVFPNPSAGLINIKFNTKASSQNHLYIIDLLGKTTTLLNAPLSAGTHTVQRELPTGAYVVILDQDGQIFRKKIVVSK